VAEAVAKAASIVACNAARAVESAEVEAALRAANRALVSVVNVVRALATVEVYPAEAMVEALASKSLKRATIFGVSVVAAAKILSESVELKVPDEVVSEVAVVTADSRESTVIARARDCKRPPVYAVASLVRVATSELMLAMSERTVVALLLVLVTGMAQEKEDARSRGRMVLMSCILRGKDNANLIYEIC